MTAANNNTYTYTMREPKTIGTLRQVADVEVDNSILVFLNYEKKLVISVYIVRRSVDDEWHFGHRFFSSDCSFSAICILRAQLIIYNIIKYNIVASFKHNHKHI